MVQMTVQEMIQQLDLLRETQRMLRERIEEVDGLVYEVEARLDHITDVEYIDHEAL
jgi:prefoldin subunit 5